MIKLPPDITFLIQLVSFVVFWQLLRVILIVPMQAALRARAERTEGARLRADSLIMEAAECDAAIQAGLADAKRDGLLRANEIRRRAESDEQAVLTRYRGEATTLLERERASTESQVTSARLPLESESARLAESIVRRVLGRAA